MLFARRKGKALGDDVDPWARIGREDASRAPRREECRRVRVAVPPVRCFRQNEMDNIVGLARGIACSRLGRDDVIGWRDEGPELAYPIALSDKRCHEGRGTRAHVERRLTRVGSGCTQKRRSIVGSAKI